MSIPAQIKALIDDQPEAKRSDMKQLHKLILDTLPDTRLWYDSGVDDKGKTVANPTIGYGFQVLKYANGKTKDFFRIGLSANSVGFSIYILGIEDKKYLINTYGKTIGKASVTGYCIKFKSLKDINIDALQTAIRDGAAER
ncbi:MAG TPA: DUF1801 domain-containing protein [Flavipsychrobacter sp.]|nr:DUF1801 domain-containing protein [Flavipsychrobacter sp.]